MNWEYISEMKDQTLIDIKINKEGDEIRFYRNDGSVVIMYHAQDCCEHVRVEDIDGDIQDLIGSPLFEAEVAWREASPDESEDESGTWTYYKLGTNKGSVSIRWLGESNGCYSEGVGIRVEAF